MNRSALPLVMVAAAGLSGLVGCGSSTAASNSTTVGTTTPTPSSVGSTPATSAGTPASSDASSATASATGASPSPSATSGTASSTPSTGSTTGARHTVDNWVVTIPAGWTGASSTKDMGYFGDWKPKGASSTQLVLVSGHLGAGETFAGDVQAALQNFGASASLDTNTPVSVKGASQAHELAGYGTDPDTGKRHYLDAVIASQGKDTVLFTAVANTRAALQAAHLHTYLLTLTHA